MHQLPSVQPAAAARPSSAVAQAQAAAKTESAGKRRQQATDDSAAMLQDVPKKKQKSAATCHVGSGSANRCRWCRGYMKGEHAKYLKEKQCHFAAGQFAKDGIVIGPPP